MRMRLVEVVEVVVALLFCGSFQVSPGEEAEVVDDFLPGLEPAFCHWAHISGTRT